MIAVGLYFLAPVYWLIVASTKSTGDLFSTPGFLFAEFNLWQNLVELSQRENGIFWRWMFNSLIYSGLGSVLMTFISVISGYALAMYRFRGRNVVLAAVIGSMLVPQTVLAQPTYTLLVNIGLNNTMLGVLLPSLVYPFGVMLGYIYAQSSVPQELLEAARMDGASEWRAFFSIALKLLSPGAVTILLFAFIGSWNNFMLPLLVLNDTRLQPVTVGLSGWSQAAITVPGLQTLVIVGALVSIIPIVIVFVSLQRYWRAGLAAGGLKL
ncbi:ABC transporter permease subunit [Phytoactinopolyspora sp. XMNu-373]|uniref:ABC transporter permease subunit n=2 Tax=Phytoactinopolyspora mesophila TaxID=2650750 RepID=A0A7K3MC39_9ACTN|nr:ABC transporter permease subunit [Phytoactinopolyspora mesophila]